LTKRLKQESKSKKTNHQEKIMNSNTPEQLAERTIRRILKQRPGAALDGPGCLSVTLTERGYLSEWLNQDRLIAALRTDDEAARNHYAAILASVRTANPDEMVSVVSFRVSTLPDLDGKCIILAVGRPKPKYRGFKRIVRRPKVG
jgi:hypothetical protein